jgi:diaminohydroxyphosphoribosylaminopyrimidine deaminase / 5-amino-6-(5-phosphoribosylamino)uracil reductase
MAVMNQDIQFMKRALELAAKARGRTSPNPLVGAVIVKNNKIIGEGYHKKAGRPHAEVEAIRQAQRKGKNKTQGATLYVNLEPCSHTGRTPPCTTAILKAGFARVVIGMMDPNPLIQGEGLHILKTNGIKVKVGVLADECAQLNEYFSKWIVRQMPFVILKVATTLDGMVATQQGDSKWLTGVEARQHVHQMRDEVDAILVGVNTVMRDDPQLTTRITGKKGLDPIRIVIDSTLYIDPKACIFNDKSKSPTWIAATEQADARKIKRIQKKKNADVIVCRDKDGRVDLHDLLFQLGQRGVTSLLVEGGPAIHSSFVNENLGDKIMVYYAPKLLGGGALSMFNGLKPTTLKSLSKLRDLKSTSIGDDILVEGYF